MAAPSAPYCEANDVAFFLTMSRGGKALEFTPESSPSETVVEHLISVIGSRIDMAYMSSGYRIPFAAKSGETWPDAQTTFLQFLNTIGVAAYMGGNVASPPVTAPGRPRSSGSLYRDEWEKLMAEVGVIGERDHRPTQALLRADVFPDTAAQWRLSVSQPATSDFLEGYYDPTRYDSLHAFTVRTKEWYTAMGTVAPTNPNYMWALHDRLGLTYAG